MQIEVEDFCHSLQNTKKGYENETLSVFAPWFELRDPFDAKEKVCVYTKFNILDLKDGAKTVVASFHKSNKPIEYLFRQKTQERGKNE